jgi:hypothetical protein
MEQVLWQEKTWKDYKESLLNLLEEVSELTHRYYPKYEEQILKEDKEIYVEKMMPKKDLHREYHMAAFIK